MPAPRDKGVLDFRMRGDRKASKPLMEKRRRARINHCLSQLKSLVVDKSHDESSRQAKLEKADILELTVRHLHDIKRHQRTSSLVNDLQTWEKFELGYVECAKEVESFLSNMSDHQQLQDNSDSSMKYRLKSHLANKFSDLKSSRRDLDSQEKQEKTESDRQDSDLEASRSPRSNRSPSPQSWKSNARQGFEVPLVPKRLPNGDLALVIPPQAFESRANGPLSSFRVICNQMNCSNLDFYQRQRDSCTSWSPSPPLSSTVSDVSVEDFQEEVENIAAMNEELQSVWRPW